MVLVIDILFIIAHLTIGIYFLNSGLNHFFNVNYLAGYAKSKGVPFAKAAVIASGVTFVLAGASLTIWAAPVIGFGLAILTLIPLTTMMHDFWNATDAMHRATERISFNKNVAIMGCLLMLLALFL